MAILASEMIDSALKRTGFCKPCLDAGHSCEATAQIDGVWMCVFCEDGEPCPKAGRKTCRQPGCFLVLPKLNESGLCSGHQKQVTDRAEKEQRVAAQEAKAAAARAPKAPKTVKSPNDSTIQRKDVPDMEHTCKSCGKEVNSNNKQRLCGDCRAKIKADNAKACSDCGAKLRADNAIGLCKACKKNHKLAGDTAKPTKRKSIGAQVLDQITTPKKRESVVTKDIRMSTVVKFKGGNMNGEVTELATIEVSEAHLDKLWTGMSLLEKAAAITQSLRAGVL